MATQQRLQSGSKSAQVTAENDDFAGDILYTLKQCSSIVLTTAVLTSQWDRSWKLRMYLETSSTK
eukprot:2550512-Pyramimonas_sp.AAC.1